MKKIIFLLTFLLSLNCLANTKVILTEDNSVILNNEFTWSTVAEVAQKAKELDNKLPSKEPLYLVLDSPGGSIDAGIELINNLNSLNRPVNTITLFAASMGFQTVQGLNGDRLIVNGGTLMSHKARGGFSGEFPGQLDSRYGYYLNRILKLDMRAVLRTKGKHTLSSYRALIENEYWCDGEDCLKQGFADDIAVVSCGESLSGTKKELYGKQFIGGSKVELFLIFSKCPTITGTLGYEVYVDGMPFNDYKNSSLTTTELADIIKVEVNSTLEKLQNNKQVIKGY